MLIEKLSPKIIADEIAKRSPLTGAFKLADGGGMHLLVARTGTCTWRFKYRRGGKEYLLTFGQYPLVTIKAARLARDEARKLLMSGRDPRLEAKRLKLVGDGAQKTFEQFAREWYETNKAQWKPVHAADVITSLERDVFPDLGPHPIADVDEPLILSTLRKVEKRGAIETARRLRQRIDRVFRYAKASGAVKSNPSDVGEGMMPVPKKKRWPAIVVLEDLHTFMDDIDTAASSPITRLASRFLALTAQRPGMVRTMRWSDVSNVDWKDPQALAPEAIWRIPAELMKQELHLRGDEAFDHEVPLAPQAVEALRAVRALTGRGPLPFCSIIDAHAPLSENAIGYLYNRRGFKGRHVPHGWRSSFSTIMNGLAERRHHGEDRLVIDRLIIDLMLAHRPSGMSDVEFRYNRARYMVRRREIAIAWADMLLKDRDSAWTLLEGRRRSVLR